MSEPFRWALFSDTGAFLGSYPEKWQAEQNVPDSGKVFTIRPLFLDALPVRDTDPAPPLATVKVNAFTVMERAVQEGVAYALQRVEREKEPLSSEQVASHVMNSVCEVFSFESH